LLLVATTTHWGTAFAPFLEHFLIALDGIAQLLPGTVFPLPGTKVVPTASSLKAC
jgi:hypothetical protein